MTVAPQVHGVQVAVPREVATGERRVAVVPDTVARLGSIAEVTVEAGAGRAAFVDDASLTSAGATVVADRRRLLQEADVVLSVQPLPVADVALLRHGAVTVSFLQPWRHGDVITALALQGVTALSLDLVPRISRAQPMDALSSQAFVAGHRAVIVAAGHAPRMFALSMTAAGTVAPAQVLVLGAGVAGLHAIATAHRLGAVVSAYDVRSESAEEVRSLGARFLEPALPAQESVGGYARVQSEELLAEQRHALAPHIAEADVVVTAAAVPGRPAPRLVSAAAVRAMRAGSVIVDLGAGGGGNCELTEPGCTLDVGGVTIVGLCDAESMTPLHASALYARNIAAMLDLLVHDGRLAPDWNDEILAACCVTRNGEVSPVDPR